MTVTELIDELQKLKEEHGDIEVLIDHVVHYDIIHSVYCNSVGDIEFIYIH